MDEHMDAQINLWIYDTTPVTIEARPGEEQITFHIGKQDTFSPSKADVFFTRRALRRFLAEGTTGLHILDMPDPEDDS